VSSVQPSAGQGREKSVIAQSVTCSKSGTDAGARVSLDRVVRRP